MDKLSSKNVITENKNKIELKLEDKLAMGHMKYGLGIGASLRYANELRAVQQTGRLPSLRSSRLHEDVLRGKLGPGNGIDYSPED